MKVGDSIYVQPLVGLEPELHTIEYVGRTYMVSSIQSVFPFETVIHLKDSKGLVFAPTLLEYWQTHLKREVKTREDRSLDIDRCDTRLALFQRMIGEAI